jgi:hypothetical protein
LKSSIKTHIASLSLSLPLYPYHCLCHSPYILVSVTPPVSLLYLCLCPSSLRRPSILVSGPHLPISLSLSLSLPLQYIIISLSLPLLHTSPLYPCLWPTSPCPFSTSLFILVSAPSPPLTLSLSPCLSSSYPLSLSLSLNLHRLLLYHCLRP